MSNDVPIAKVWRVIVRRARIAHVCCACDETIVPQHRYVLINSLYDGNWSTYKRCLRCHAIAIQLEGFPGVVAADLECDSDPLRPDAHPTLDRLAFMTPDEAQEELSRT